jgi:hypothetical protein
LNKHHDKTAGLSFAIEVQGGMASSDCPLAPTAQAYDAPIGRLSS